MTAPIQRPGEWRTLGDHEKRIRILEASPGGDEAGATVFCVGCYEVAAEFAECVNLIAGDCLDVAQVTIGQSNPSVSAVAGTDFEIGPYLCNYLAGFRVQTRYIGEIGGLSSQMHMWNGVGHDGAAPTSWTDMGVISDGTTHNIDTGWVTNTADPTGLGANGDPWQVWMGADNDSVLFDGTIGAGEWCFRYVQVADLANVTPQPQIAGQILIALGTPPVWTLLDPGTAGQVLTMSGGVPTWV